MDAFLIPHRFAACALLGLAGHAMAQTATAPDTPQLAAPSVPYRWRVELSPYTTHFSPRSLGGRSPTSELNPGTKPADAQG